MTEPTQEEYKALAGILDDALDHCNEVRLYGDNLFTAYKALRLAANLPSQTEMTKIIIDNPDYHQAAALILERVRSVK